MPLKKKDFYGKEVTDAIKKACEELGVAQGQLDIDIVETGSTGIFGLIRKKAHIKASVRPPEQEAEGVSASEVQPKEVPTVQPRPVQKSKKAAAPAVPKEEKKKENEDLDDETVDASDEEDIPEVTSGGQISQESLDIVRQELTRLLDLMGYPSEITMETGGSSVLCCIQGGFDEALTGPDGKTLDSLQYIMRKIITRKVPERIRLAIDIGDYRERRQKELAEKALELAKLVKENGKTQVLPALNPSERRVVHMALQDDKEIRSRSVGEGLFKKILIYKPGKGKKNGPRKHHSSRGTKARDGKEEA